LQSALSNYEIIPESVVQITNITTLKINLLKMILDNFTIKV
jgi:hypothetical protein